LISYFSEIRGWLQNTSSFFDTIRTIFVAEKGDFSIKSVILQFITFNPILYGEAKQHIALLTAFDHIPHAHHV